MRAKLASRNDRKRPDNWVALLESTTKTFTNLLGPGTVEGRYCDADSGQTNAGDAALLEDRPTWKRIMYTSQRVV